MSERAESGASGLKIYFAGAIRGGHGDEELYGRLIAYLGGFGRVLTGHVGDPDLLAEERLLTEKEIFQRDMAWLAEADLVVAEVTTPSLGVGYEIALAESLGKKIFCLYRPDFGRRLSAMIDGNPALRVARYGEQREAEVLLAEWLAGCC